MEKLLIVEDEEAIRTGLVDVFVYHGYQVDFAEDGAIGLNKALTEEYDLIVLDVMLPSLNGFEICQQVREKKTEQAIIMLTAKTADEDIIKGFSLGADDYVAKPFSITQLVLRVKAVLRRSGKQNQLTNQIVLDSSTIIDLTNYVVRKKEIEEQLTKRELEVVNYLFRHADRPVSRDELLEKVWGYDAELALETRTVDIHIAKIRRKIECDPKSPVFLVTVRGAGYKLIHQEEI